MAEYIEAANATDAFREIALEDRKTCDDDLIKYRAYAVDREPRTDVSSTDNRRFMEWDDTPLGKGHPELVRTIARQKGESRADIEAQKKAVHNMFNAFTAQQLRNANTDDFVTENYCECSEDEAAGCTNKCALFCIWCCDKLASTEGVQLQGGLRGRRLCRNAACQAAWCRSHHLVQRVDKEEVREIRCKENSEDSEDSEWVQCLEIHTDVVYEYVAASTKEDSRLSAVKTRNGVPENHEIYRYKFTEANKEGAAGYVGEWPSTIVFEPHDLIWELTTRTTALHHCRYTVRPHHAW